MLFRSISKLKAYRAELKGVAAEPEYGGKFLFAGEHTSQLYSGTAVSL